MPTVKIKLSGESEVFECDKRDTILDAAQDEGVALPFGCTSGSCHICMGKVLKGEVDRGGMYDTLDDNMKAKNYILCCQAKCLSDEVEIDFDA